MTAIVSTIEIARPPDEVFSYVTDPSRFPEWQHDVVRVELEHSESGDGPAGPGTRYATIRRIGGVERAMTQQIVESTPPRTWAVHGVEGAIRANANVTVEPLDGGARSR